MPVGLVEFLMFLHGLVYRYLRQDALQVDLFFLKRFVNKNFTDDLVNHPMDTILPPKKKFF